MSRPSKLLLLTIAVCIGCQPDAPPPAVKKAAGPTVRATVIAIRTTMKPEDRTQTRTIVIAGDKAEYRNNGETLKRVPVKGKASAFGIRAEFGPIQIRNIRAKE